MNQQLITVQTRIHYHDRLCRTTHREIAAYLGNGWEDYLLGLLKVLHYADHTEANLWDVRGYMNNVFAIITADRNVSRKELQRLLEATTEVYQVLAQVYHQSSKVQLDISLAQAFKGLTWSQALGEFKLSHPNETNITQWLNAIDSWINKVINLLAILKIAALEQLLHSEKLVADSFKTSQTLPQAPTPSKISGQYPVLLPGKERKRQTRLGWWDRFQTADGFVAEILRLLVATVVIVSVLVFAAGIK